MIIGGLEKLLHIPKNPKGQMQVMRLCINITHAGALKVCPPKPYWAAWQRIGGIIPKHLRESLSSHLLAAMPIKQGC